MVKPRIEHTAAVVLIAIGLVLSCLPQDVSARELRQYRRPWRSGIFSFGIQGQYGYETGGTKLSDPFDWGPGLAITARYTASKEYSLGARFEVHNFWAREDSIEASEIYTQGGFGTEGLIGIDEMRVTTAGVDLYYFLNRGRETMTYLNAGLGLYQLAILLKHDPNFELGQSARIERDNMYLMGGAGLEHFLRRSVSLDLSGKVFAYLGGKGGTPLTGQVAGGIQVYFFD
jgi:hypothetical protein